MQEFSEIQFLRFHLFFMYLWSRLSKGNLPEDYVGPTEKLFHKNLDNNMIQEFEILKKTLNKKNQNILTTIFNFINIKITTKKNLYNGKNFNPKKIENIILSQNNSKILSELFLIYVNKLLCMMLKSFITVNQNN